MAQVTSHMKVTAATPAYTVIPPSFRTHAAAAALPNPTELPVGPIWNPMVIIGLIYVLLFFIFGLGSWALYIYRRREAQARARAEPKSKVGANARTKTHRADIESGLQTEKPKEQQGAADASAGIAADMDKSAKAPQATPASPPPPSSSGFSVDSTTSGSMSPPASPDLKKGDLSSTLTVPLRAHMPIALPSVRPKVRDHPRIIVTNSEGVPRRRGLV